MSEIVVVRPIRSFVRREVRITDAQIRAIEQHYPKYGVLLDDCRDLSTLFPNQNPVIIEIGFGDGESLLNQAQLQPEFNFLGIEVHRPGLGILLSQLSKTSLSNLRVAQYDALDVLAQLKNQSLQGIQIFFPDPWQKNRHNKRRLIQASFLESVLPTLVPGGFIHCATDWEHYAIQIFEVLSADPRLKNTSPTHTTIERPPHRILSKFERRGLSLGHQVWDYLFLRKNDVQFKGP